MRTKRWHFSLKMAGERTVLRLGSDLYIYCAVIGCLFQTCTQGPVNCVIGSVPRDSSAPMIRAVMGTRMTCAWLGVEGVQSASMSKSRLVRHFFCWEVSILLAYRGILSSMVRCERQDLTCCVQDGLPHLLCLFNMCRVYKWPHDCKNILYHLIIISFILVQ